MALFGGRVDLSSIQAGSVPSDKYNASTVSAGSAYGFGLGHTSASDSSMHLETAAPLTPFAGIDRRALIPSPVKAAMQMQVSFQPLSASFQVLLRRKQVQLGKHQQV